LAHLTEGFLPPGAIPLLKAASELIPAAFDLVEVIFREPPPVLFGLALERGLVAQERMPLHRFSPARRRKLHNAPE
jgi:hypothetical protein